MNRAAWELDVDERLRGVWDEFGPALDALKVRPAGRLTIGQALRTAYAIGYRAGVDDGRELEPGELPPFAEQYFARMAEDGD